MRGRPRLIALIGLPGGPQAGLGEQLAERLRAEGQRALCLPPVKLAAPSRADLALEEIESQWQAAAADGAAAWLITATPPLALALALAVDRGSAAVLSDQSAPTQPGDRSEWASFLQRAARLQARADLSLLTPSGRVADPALQEAQDAAEGRLRELLGAAALPYSVLHGSGAAQVNAAWRALQTLLHDTAAGSDDTGPQMRPMCSECVVPECEHLQGMFSGLMGPARG